MIYGYARISTSKQNIERQVRNIEKYCDKALIIKETYTGTKIEREKWTQLFNQVHEGDTIIFDSVSRMSRNAEEGYNAYQELYDRGVELVFLKEPQINTNTYKQALNDCSLSKTGTAVDYILEGVTKYLMCLAKEQIRLAFDQSEKEVSDLRERTKEGIETARLNGKQIGQKPGTKFVTKKSVRTKEIILKHSKDFGGSLNDAEVIQLAGVSRNSYYKYKKELKSGIS